MVNVVDPLERVGGADGPEEGEGESAVRAVGGVAAFSR
jgi:hypothetical protein